MARARICPYCTIDSTSHRYSNPPPCTRFVTKTISIGTTVPWSEEQGLFRVESIAPLGPGLEVKTTTETTEYIERANPFANGLEIAGFLRFPKLGRGAFVSVANPWAKYSFDEDNAKISAIYVASMEHRPSALTGDVHVADPVVLGFTSISKYYSSATGLSTSESRAFRNCVSHFLLDWDSRKKNGAVKVNVGFCFRSWRVHTERNLTDRLDRWHGTRMTTKLTSVLSQDEQSTSASLTATRSLG